MDFACCLAVKFTPVAPVEFSNPAFTLLTYPHGMLRILSHPSTGADFLALEAVVERAGCALACPFSSSDEYEAALIAERRAAGVYGPRRQRRQLMVTLAGVAAAVLTIVALVASIPS